MPTALIIILCAVLCIFSYMIVLFITSILYTHNNNTPYRIGDGIRRLAFMSNFYDKDSIVCQYYTNSPQYRYKRWYDWTYEPIATSLRDLQIKVPDVIPDFATLLKVVKEHPSYVEGEDNVLNIHVRIGDVLEMSNKSVQEMLDTEEKCSYLTEANIGVRGSVDGTTSCGYIKPLSFFKSVLPKIDRNRIDTVVICGGCHQNCMDMSKSKAYCARIAELFEDQGFKTVIRITVNKSFKDADKDFVYLCASAHLVPSAGGFAELIKNVAQQNGCNILS